MDKKFCDYCKKEMGQVFEVDLPDTYLTKDDVEVMNEGEEEPSTAKEWAENAATAEVSIVYNNDPLDCCPACFADLILRKTKK